MGRTLNRLGISLEPGSEDWLRAARRAARALIEVADENIHREQGVYRTDNHLSSMSRHVRGADDLVATRTSLPVLPTSPVQSAARASHAEAAPMQSLPETSPMPSAPSVPTLAKGVPDLTCPRQPTSAVRDHETAVSASLQNDADNSDETERPIQSINEPSFDDEASYSLTAESRFSAWFEAAMNLKREDNPGWDTNNLGNWRATKKLFIEAHGDRPMGSYTKSQLFEFRSLLCALPKNHHKSSDSPGLYTIIDETEAEEARNMILAENEIHEHRLNRGDAEQRRATARVARVRVATVYRHMQAIQFVFRHAADHGAAPVNAMKRVIWTTKQLDKLKAEEKDMRRLPWGDKLVDLLNTTAFTHPLVPGENVHDVFWPTLIASHSGMRQEEVLQLKTDDCDTMKGIPFFRIQSGEGQHLKSESSSRIVPIHRNLIELGLMRYVEECRRKGQEWLFPEINRCAAKGRLSGTFTKTFGHYRIQQGVYDPRRDFHSLRTHFNVELKRAECPLEIRKRLLGHKLRDITEEHYDPEGSPIEEYKEWVDGLEIDISNIRSPYCDLSKRLHGKKIVDFASHR
ncbi:site-specific integrase [Rhodobacteraceae bacterium R_SAG2]|nr:site-specific integrase [Rhodobacteraceae bacterium R_SAG2]